MRHTKYEKIQTYRLMRIIASRLALYSVLIAGGLYLVSPGVVSGQYNGFIIGPAPLIPEAEIHRGGPPKDGIPAIDKPQFIPARDASDLSPGDRVIGLIASDGPKAYPVRILNWHELVNDGDIIVSYCPLCGTGMAFQVPTADFGVSGLLYNSDMLLYDRKTESLWSQILGQAISGERKGEKLHMLAVENTSWQHWQETHPDTLVLSNKTGYSRNYSNSPYGQYDTSKALYFPVSQKSKRYHPKEKVIGIELNVFKAYPFIELDKSAVNVLKDKVAGQAIEIHFNRQHRSGYIRLASGKTLATLTSYWFAWYAFHPETQVYTFKDK